MVHTVVSTKTIYCYKLKAYVNNSVIYLKIYH
jgi:hypothetical protein